LLEGKEPFAIGTWLRTGRWKIWRVIARFLWPF
jgi:hypothetical protein